MNLGKIGIARKTIGRFIPNAVKREYKAINTGVSGLRNRILNNYSMGVNNARMKRSTRCYQIGEGLVNAFATNVTKAEVPSLFAFIGTFTPIPVAGPAGYVVGKIGTSPAVANACKASKNIVNKTCHVLGLF